MSFRLASFIQSAAEQPSTQRPRLVATAKTPEKRPARLPTLCRRRDPAPTAQSGAASAGA